MIKTKIDKDFLKSIELNVEDEQTNKRNVAMIFTILDRAVDYRVKDELGLEAAKEYLVAKSNKDLFTPWQEKNLPNFDDLVSEELTKIKEDMISKSKEFEKFIKDNS